MAAAGSKPPSNVGCVIAIVALPVVILLGVVIGTVLRSDDDADEEEHVTLDDGELDSIEWRVDAVRDIEGATCIFLYEDGAEDPLNGTCDLEPQDVTYGDQTVVFGRAEADDAKADIEAHWAGDVDPGPLALDTTTADGMEGRFYVAVVDGDLDVVPRPPS